MAVQDPSRRDFVRRGAYVAPAVLTLAAAPQFAKAGSVKPGRGDGGKHGRGDDGKHGKGGGKGDRKP